MKCHNCNAEVQTNSLFCPSCRGFLNTSNIGVLASPARRLIAYFIDYGMVLLLIVLSFVEPAFSILLIIFGVVEIIMLFRSTTLAKKLLGMRVYKKDGTPVGFLKMFLRETIGKILSGLIFSLGYIWILIDDENQAWHDKLIGSVVIREKR